MAKVNGVQFIQAIADCYGKTITDDEAQYIAWNFTGYPSFWMTDRPIEEMRHQAAAYLRGERFCARCGKQVEPHDIEVVGVCTPCAIDLGWREAA